MNFYFMICGALTFLVLFGVFERLLKFHNLNRWIVSCFLLLSCIFSAINNVVIMGVEVSLNTFLYIFAFCAFFVKVKSVKNYLKILLCALIMIAILMCYNAIEISDFEYSFVGVYVYVGLFLGLVLNFILPNVKTTFCGVTIGTLAFDIIYFNYIGNLELNTFVIMPTSSITFIFVTVFSFAVFNYVVEALKSIKSKKKQEI